jgi:hypothetical protein
MAVTAGTGRVPNQRPARQLSEYKHAIARLQHTATLNQLKWRMLEAAILASGHTPESPEERECPLCTELRRARRL